jgi:hypothetical protein
MSNTSSHYICFQAFQREILFVFRRLGERNAPIVILKEKTGVGASSSFPPITLQAQAFHSFLLSGYLTTT